MQTHVIAKRDSDERVYSSVIVAPDHPTALRIFAMEMLTQHGGNLHDAREPSLAEYADISYLDEDWEAGPGKACPCCSSQVTRTMGAFEMAGMGVSPVTNAGRCHLCAACAHVWIDIGSHAETRRILEEEARMRMAALDGYEKTSLMGEQ